MGGRLLGIACRSLPRAPMERLDRAEVTLETGVANDWRGRVRGNRNRRQVSLLAREDWERTCADLGEAVDWWERRANLYVEGLRLPRLPGVILRIGEVRLEVTMETDPCRRMDEVMPGLMAALVPDWRGGVLARVIHPGRIVIGDPVDYEDNR